jgi:hypothetical protein
MSQKILPFSSNKLKTDKDNFFYMPRDFLLRKSPGYSKYRVDNLKPNTRYKIAIDNSPDRIFEDITQFVRPTGSGVLVNLDDDNQKNTKYIKTDERGTLEYEVKIYGTDAATISANNTFTPPHLGSPVDAELPDHSSYWENEGDRKVDDDNSRENIRIIEYADFNEPDSDDKDKETAIEVFPLPADPPKPGDDEQHVETPVGAQAYQTFFVDSKAVKGADCVDITDISLYFRKKPRRTNNLSGINNPLVTVMLMACKDDGTPDPTNYFEGGISRKEWSEIQASPTADIDTVFTFREPIRVKTDRFYAFAVKLQDQDYLPWTNTKGDLLLVNGNKTEKRSGGSTKEHLGDLYEPRSFTKNPASTAPAGELEWSADKNKDLKFDVHINQYEVTDQSVPMCTRNYEFLQLTNTTNRWAPGEIVYKDGTSLLGTTSITKGKRVLTNDGSASLAGFVDGDKIVVADATDITKAQVFTVDTSTFTPTATSLVVEEVARYTMAGTAKPTVVGIVQHWNPLNNYLTLIDSSVNRTQYAADNTKRFVASDVVIGIESFNSGTISGVSGLPLSTFRCNFNGSIPPMFKVDTKYNFSVFVESSNTFSLQTDDTLMYLNAPNHVRGYQAELMSRSLEVAETGLANNNYKSANFTIDYTFNGSGAAAFCAPTFRTDALQLITHRWSINNDTTDEHKSFTKDNETGAALSKMISKKLNFGQDKKAEDVRVIANVHTPVGTSIEMYAKVYNSEDNDSFDDKQWTKMLQIGGRDITDNRDDQFAYHEVEYQLPFFPQGFRTLTGEITTTLDSTTIQFDTAQANTAQLDALERNQVVKLYSTLFPTNYQLFSIESANSSSGEVVLQQPVANSGMVGEGFRMDTLKDGHTAFRNPDNFEIARYFGYEGQTFDTYDQVAIKIVLLSNSNNVVPKVNDYRVIGVSA